MLSSLAERGNPQQRIEEHDGKRYYYHGQKDLGSGARVLVSDLIQKIQELHTLFLKEEWSYAQYGDLANGRVVNNIHTRESLGLTPDMAMTIFRLYASWMFKLEQWQKELLIQANVFHLTDYSMIDEGSA